jgi:predicted RNA-binding Zn ribbon-like protein
MRQRAPRYDLPKAAPGRLRLVQQFVNTTDHGHTNTRELLATPAALASWLASEGFEIRPVGPAALRRAHAVRDALHELVVSGRAGEALEAAADRAKLTLDLEAGELRARAPGVDGALGTILAAVYDALHDGSWERLKACRNCGWAFWDESRNRSAAWCSMQLCGNRLKVRRHRDKVSPRSSR